jgi:hypothetical protein
MVEEKKEQKELWGWTTYASVLQLDNINRHQKDLLCIAMSFYPKGCTLGNYRLGQALNLKAHRHISDLLTDLAFKGHIEIQNFQSKYRVFYFLPKGEVNKPLLPCFVRATSLKKGKQQALLPLKMSSTSPTGGEHKEIQGNTEEGNNNNNNNNECSFKV